MKHIFLGLLKGISKYQVLKSYDPILDARAFFQMSSPDHNFEKKMFMP